MALLVILVLLITAEALWERRYTWRVPWETASTMNVALQAVEVALMKGPIERFVSPHLHAVLGMWNVEELFGHLCYMAGMSFMTYMLLSRLDMSDQQLSRFVKTRIELPATVFVPVTVLIFVLGGLGDSDAMDLVLAHQTPWTRLYFMMYVAGVSYLLYIAAQALLVIRRDKSQRRVANFYMCAVFLSAVSCAVLAVNLWPMVTWVAVRVETAVYALAAVYSWRMRVKGMRGSHPCNH